MTPELSLHTNTVFPLVNACLNAAAAFFLLLGFVWIKRGQREAHRKAMITAFVISAAFLVNYLWYHFHYSSNRFGGTGLIRPLYFGMLISHIVLAVVIVPLILKLLWLASKQNYAKHARLGRWVWPLWMYTSVTGVLVYLMLYQWYPSPPSQHAVSEVNPQ